MRTTIYFVRTTFYGKETNEIGENGAHYDNSSARLEFPIYKTQFTSYGGSWAGWADLAIPLSKFEPPVQEIS